MAVAFDAEFTVVTDVGGATSFTSTALTVGSGANRALVVGLDFDATVTSISVHWDSTGTNQAMTLIGTQAVGSGATRNVVYLYGLVAPTSGNHTLAVSWTTSCGCDAWGMSFTGVDQTGSTTSFPNAAPATGTTSPATVAQTSAAGNYTMAVFSDPDQTISSVNGTQGTINNTSGNNFAVAFQRQAGAASVTQSATLAGTSVGWAVISTDIKAAGAAVANPAFQPWFQMAPVMAQ